MEPARWRRLYAIFGEFDFVEARGQFLDDGADLDRAGVLWRGGLL